MTDDDVAVIYRAIHDAGGIRATVRDMAGYYHQSEARCPVLAGLGRPGNLRFREGGDQAVQRLRLLRNHEHGRVGQLGAARAMVPRHERGGQEPADRRAGRELAQRPGQPARGEQDLAVSAQMIIFAPELDSKCV